MSGARPPSEDENGEDVGMLEIGGRSDSSTRSKKIEQPLRIPRPRQAGPLERKYAGAVSPRVLCWCALS